MKVVDPAHVIFLDALTPLTLNDDVKLKCTSVCSGTDKNVDYVADCLVDTEHSCLSNATKSNRSMKVGTLDHCKSGLNREVCEFPTHASRAVISHTFLLQTCLFH